MYDQNEGKLERVKSESELKVGMACKIINCNNCNNSHYFNISKMEFYDGECNDRKGFLYDCKGPIFLTVPSFCGYEWLHFHNTISEGRLFKIVDENPIADIITNVVKTNKPKVKVKIK